MADELKNLPPEERIKKLKELEKQRKKEIEEAQKVIKDSEEELTARRKWTDRVPIPEMGQDDFANLSAEGQEILRLGKGLQKKEEPEEKPASSRKSTSELEEALN